MTQNDTILLRYLQHGGRLSPGDHPNWLVICGLTD